MKRVKPSGLLTDPRFREHRAPYEHPERPERLAAIEERLEAEGLADRCRRVPAREATDEELLTVHTAELLADVAATADRPFTQLDPDTYANSASARAARLAAGGLIDMARAVASDEIANGLALVRPPGHHAEAGQAMGFWLFNNVAVAARNLKPVFRNGLAGPKSAARVLIADWDVHHGNGTQNTFWNDPSVLYFSTHQAPFYPGTGAIPETGGPDARGYTVNVPWPAGRGDADHLSAFDRVLLPIATRFDPDLVIVSAGFDAAEGDLLGEQRISPAGYAAMTERLGRLAGGRLVLALEGGYTLEAIAASAAACLRVLLGEEPPAKDFGQPSPTAERILDAVVAAQNGW
jgi:histone deacetylase 6